MSCIDKPESTGKHCINVFTFYTVYLLTSASSAQKAFEEDLSKNRSPPIDQTVSQSSSRSASITLALADCYVFFFFKELSPVSQLSTGWARKRAVDTTWYVELITQTQPYVTVLRKRFGLVSGSSVLFGVTLSRLTWSPSDTVSYLWLVCFWNILLVWWDDRGQQFVAS